MKDTSTIRAGLFVIIALAILVVGSLWVAGFHPGGTERATYEILMKSSGGVRQNDVPQSLFLSRPRASAAHKGRASDCRQPRQVERSQSCRTCMR